MNFISPEICFFVMYPSKPGTLKLSQTSFSFPTSWQSKICLSLCQKTVLCFILLLNFLRKYHVDFFTILISRFKCNVCRGNNSFKNVNIQSESFTSPTSYNFCYFTMLLVVQKLTYTPGNKYMELCILLCFSPKQEHFSCHNFQVALSLYGIALRT